jgi:FAD synthetase
VNNTSNLKTRIMVFGTFDGLHKGHENFFKQARKLSKNPFLIVSVARDVNVKKIKGKKPLNSEKARLRFVKTSRFVNKAVLGGLKNHLTHILKEKPQIVGLGYDQKAYVKELKRDIKSGKLNLKLVRLKPYKPQLLKSSIINGNRN